MRTVPAGEVARDPRAQRRRDVPFELTVTVVAVAIPRARASARASSTSPPGRWKCELGRALDGRPGEERPVGQQAQALAARRAGFGGGCRQRLRGLGPGAGSGACSPTSPNGMPP